MAKMKTNHKHYSAGAVIWIIIKYFSLVFFSFVALLPIVSCVITAFKTDAEYQSTNVMTLPESWLNFQNFIDAFNRANMGRAYLNSAIILVFVLLGSVLVGTQLAYVLNRFKFPGNGLIRSLFLFATLLPGIAMQVSVYQFMENISVSLDESAFIDGASYFTIYWKIILPLLKPAIVTSMVLKGVGVYNEYYCASLYLQDKRTLGVVATSLYTFTGPLGSKYNLICAGVLMSLLPALIVFLLCQKQIYSGITSGAVKG